MSIESISLALNRTDVSGATKLVLIGIANHDGDGGSWPTRASLARYASISERHVKRCVQELIEAGLVEVDYNAGGTLDWRDDRRPNRYVLHLDEVKPVSPRESDGGTSASSRDFDGGTSSAPRGDIQGQNGGTPRSPKPSSNHPLEPSTSSRDAEFEEFWAMYGRVGPKKVARKSWEAARKKASHEEILKGLERWVAYWRSPGAAKVKWPQGWLTEERWKDEPPSLLSVVQSQPALTPGQQALLRRRIERQGVWR